MGSKSRRVLAALVAVLALGAVSAASASAAAPEFVLKAGESFPSGIGNTLHSGRVAFGWTSQQWGECSENKMSGTITGAKAVSLTLESTGCKEGTTGEHSEGAPEGHIVVTGTGQLSYIARSTEQVGIVLALKEVNIVIGSSNIKLSGSLVVPIGPLNSEASKFALPIHEAGAGVQEFGTWENEGRDLVIARPQILFGTSSKSAGLEVGGANELTTDKTVTVSASPPPPLPEFVLGEGGKFPVGLEGASPAAKVTLASAAGSITCEGVTTKGSITSGTASSLTLELKHCKTGAGSECSTAGSEEGRLVFEGAANLFYIKKSEKRVGLVFTLGTTQITCGTSKDKVQGTLVIPVTPISTQTTGFDIALTRNGEAYENTYTTYENATGEVVTVKLELNYGTGYKKGVLSAGELPLSANKTLTIGA